MILNLAINRIPNITPGTRKRIAALSGDAGGFIHLSGDTRALLSCLDSNRGRTFLEKMNRNAASQLCQQAEKDARFCRLKGVSVLSQESHEYPSILTEIHDSPFLLFVLGHTDSLGDTAIGVVGTRRPSGFAREAASAAGKDLVQNGCTVISGLARGIDQCAHKGSVDAGGKTVAVLGSGIDRIYPAGGRKLVFGIVENGGAVISEYSPGTPPARFRFPERNRIITGLSKAVLVIEAPPKSGSLITADFCLDYNRELFFHSAGMQSGFGTGAAAYIEDGALSVSSVCEMLCALGLPFRKTVEYPKSLMERLMDDLSVSEVA